MIRILHLLPTQTDFQSGRAHELLAGQLGKEFAQSTATIGWGGTHRDLPTCVWRLRQSEKFDVVHAWGMQAMTAAVLAGCARICFSPVEFPTSRAIKWIGAVMQHRPLEVICPTATMRRALLERGIPIEQCHLIRPGVDFSRVRRRRDNGLRTALGFAETDFVLLAAGESTVASAQQDAVWAAAILHKLNPKYHILLWGRGERLAKTERVATYLQEPQMLQVAERRLKRRMEYEDLLPACDGVIVTSRAPIPTLPICITMAAGLPIISSVSYTVSELLEDRHTALMTVDSRPKSLAQRVLDLVADSQLQWSISDMARTEAYEYFALTRFINQHRGAYRQMVEGKRVEIVEPTPGGGARFHGIGAG